MLAKLIAATLVLTVFVSHALAQSASLQGFVSDQNGAVVPNAIVTASAENGIVKTVTTDKAGFYSFRALPSEQAPIAIARPRPHLRLA